MDKNNVTIRLSKDTEVKQALKYAGVYDPASVKKLTVTGVFSSGHFHDVLKQMGQTLQELDLNDASFDKHNWYTNRRDCPALVSIVLPASVSDLYPDMFSHLTGLNSIFVHHDNQDFVTETGILFSKDKTKLVRFPTGRKGAYTVPDTVVEIGDYAFSGCAGLTSATIPDSVVTLGYYAFHNCTGLTSVDMPKSLKYKKNKVFENCKNLPYYIETQNNLIKQGKIKQLQKTSALDWVDNLMKNSKYPYKIEKKHETKLHLSVKINEKVKLEIPVYFRNFQQIIPQLMDTIARYEACIKESEITVFIEDVTYDNRYWKNKM